MEFFCKGNADGSLDFGERNTTLFKIFLRDNPGIKLCITPVLPESAKQRGYFEGCLISLITFYQDVLDHRSEQDRRRVREWVKTEFNGEMLVVGGKAVTVPGSTKGREKLQAVIEKVQNWLVENYAPPIEALDPASYKKWRDEVYPHGGPDNFIDYLVETGVLRKQGELNGELGS
jgi:hypothetical protein